MTRNIVKFAAGGIIIAAVGAGALFGMQYFRMQSDPEYQQMQEAQKIMGEWERLYREDTYGGATPQETLTLFIEALKKGDTDLAAKYFVPDEQEKWAKKLAVGKSNGSLPQFIEIYSRTGQGSETFKGHYIYSITNEKQEEEFSISFVLNEATNKWKISDF